MPPCSPVVNSHSHTLPSPPTDLKNISSKKSSTPVGTAKAINTLYDGPVMVQNTTAGSRDPPSPIAKHSTFGWKKMSRAQPLGSFFPLGFLMPPDRAPLVDAEHFTLFYFILTHLLF